MNVFATYHPSAIKQDEAKYGETFLMDMAKLSAILKGKAPDLEPTVLEPGDPAVPFVLSQDTLACDIETAGLNTTHTTMIGIGTWSQVVVVRLDHAYRHNGPDGFEIGTGARDRTRPTRMAIQAALANPAQTKVFQNGAFDIPILEANGYAVRGPVRDTMVAGYILKPDGNTNLAHLASLYLDVPTWKHLNTSDPVRYNALDVAWASALWRVLEAKLTETGQLEFFCDHLMPVLMDVIIPLNANGVAVDLDVLRRLRDDHRTKLDTWHDRVTTHFEALSRSIGQSLAVPIGKLGSISTKKAQHLLYEVFGLPKRYHPKTKALTVDQQTLGALEPLDETGTVTMLLERSRLKASETHLKMEPDRDGLVRARYVLGGDEKHAELTVGGTGRRKDAPGTGRLAAREPNLQNVPDPVRVVFVPLVKAARGRPGWWFVEGDSSQIEARLTARMSGDTNLQAAIDEGDVYLYTAYLIDRLSGIFKLDWPDPVTGLMHASISDRGWDWVKANKSQPVVKAARDDSKASFLGWSYRMGPKKLQLTTGMAFARAKQVLELLNQTFRGVTAYWDRLVDDVARDGYLVNAYGRRRYFPCPGDQVPQICNFPAQSTAADILFEGQLRLVKTLRGHGRHVVTVHDSNLVEGPDRERLAAIVHGAMEFEVTRLDGLVIPCTVKVGRSWGQMEVVRVERTQDS